MWENTVYTNVGAGNRLWITFNDMETQVRVAYPSISLGGADYFDKLAPYFLSLTYVDDCSGEKADDLQLHLADRDRRFISDWMPDKGASLDVAIIAERWFSPNSAALKLDCGEFWIDSVDFLLPEHTVSVKATSIPTDVRLKASEATRGWENTSLQDIAKQIAGENKLSVQWEADFNPRYNRVEQVSQSDLAFLQQRAIDAKLSIKVARRKLIFFDEQTYEEKAPSFTVVYGNASGASGMSAYRMSGGHFITRLTDTTKKASVAHVNPATAQLTNEAFSASDLDVADEEQDEKVNEDPGYASDNEGGEPDLSPRRAEGDLPLWSMNEASASGQRKAKSVVRHKNKDKFRASIDLSIGNPLVAAGQTCQLAGVGQFDGKWFVESVIHNVGPAFTTKLELRRCLQGY